MEINHKKHYIVSIAVTVGYILYLIFLLFLNVILIEDITFNNEVDELSSFMYIFSAVTYLGYCITHMLLTSLIFTRMSLINECLRLSIITKESDHLLIVRKIRILHIKVAETVELFNFYFTFNVIIYFLQYMFYMLFNLFRLFHFLTSPIFLIGELHMMILGYVWNFYYFWAALWLVLFSSWIESEGNNTLILLQTLTFSYNDPKTLAAVKLAKLQMSHKKVVISCGLFEINWSFLAIIFGSVISYLIILIQFNSL